MSTLVAAPDAELAPYRRCGGPPRTPDPTAPSWNWSSAQRRPTRRRQYTHQHTKEWSATVESGDAYAFVMPEYSYGMNAPMKNGIDYLRHEWQHKPAGLVSYGGVSAGTRAVQMANQVVTTPTAGSRRTTR